MKRLIAIALVVLPSIARTAPADKQPGDIISGTVSLKLGNEVITLAVPGGSIKKSNDIFTVELMFKDSKDTSDNVSDNTGKRFRLQFAAQKAGRAPVTTTMLAKSGATESAMRGGAKCKVVTTKLTDKEAEGTVTCSGELRTLSDEPAKPVTDVKFSVVAM